jgi:hypothetical protein
MSLPWTNVRLATRTPATSVIASSGPDGNNPKWKGKTAKAWLPAASISVTAIATARTPGKRFLMQARS